MLNKLIKYDLKWIYRGVIVFYILSLLFSVITRIFSFFDDSFIFNIITQILNGVSITMIVNILINNIMRVWARFNNNMYKDESYLTHTLPVTKKQIYLSKIISAVISLFVSVVVIIISLAILYYSQETIDFLKKTFELAETIYNIDVIKVLVIVFVILFLEFMFAIICGFLGMIIGHKSNNYKMVKSIAIGIAIYYIASFLILGVIYLVSLFDPSFNELFTTTSMIEIDTLRQLMYVIIPVYILYTYLGYIVGNKLLKNGVDVD